MRTRLFLGLMVFGALALLLTWTVTADGPPPPFRGAPPPAGPRPEGLGLDGRGRHGTPTEALAPAEVRAAEVTVGEPGLSFRYERTYGTAGRAYLDTSTHLNYPYGVFAQGSSVWIGELYGRRAMEYNSGGTHQAQIGTAGSMFYDHPDGWRTIASVYDVAVDNDGNIWIADGEANHVMQFDPDGTPLIELGEEWAWGSDNEHFGYPNSIAFDSAGNIYVSDGSVWHSPGEGNNRIQIFDAGGVYQGTLEGGFNGPGHITVYGDRLYVPDRGHHCVKIYDISNPYDPSWQATLGSCGTSGTTNHRFNGPSGVAVDANSIYVADTGNHRVQVFRKTDLGYVATIGGSKGAGNNQFNEPSDVAVDASGNIYVADLRNTRVQQFLSSRVHRRTYGVTGVPYTTNNSLYNHPEGLAAAGDGSLYIAEGAGKRLVRLRADGAPLWSATPSNIPGVMGYWLKDVALGSDGRAYVVDGWGARVYVYNSNRTLFTTFGSEGSGNTQFRDPQGIGVDPRNGDLYIADAGNHRVQIFTASRTYKATMGVTGVPGDDNNRFYWPCDVVIASNGTIYVADEGNDRVQVFNSNRQYVRTIGLPGDPGLEFDQFGRWGPHRLAVDGQNRLYVADSDNTRVQVFDAQGRYLTTIGGSWGDRTGQLRGPFGIAIGPDGAVYVADNQNHRVQRYQAGVPGWRQQNINGFGSIYNWWITALQPFDGSLYSGTLNPSGAQLWRSDDGRNWEQVIGEGFGEGHNFGIDDLAVFQGQLYASTWADESSGGEIWRTSDGEDWNQVVSGGFGDPTNAEIFCLGTFTDTSDTEWLYATTWSSDWNRGFEVWRSATGNSGSWQLVLENGFGDPGNECGVSMETFNGSLYVGTWNWSGCSLLRTEDGTNWTRVGDQAFGDPECLEVASLCSFGDYLYAGLGTWNGGGQLWRCQADSGCDDEDDWEQVVGDAFGNSNNRSIQGLAELNGYLYAVTANTFDGLEVYRSAAGGWEKLGSGGLGDSNNYGMNWNNSIATFNDSLYLGTFNRGNGGEVWTRLNLNQRVFLPYVVKSYR